MTGKRYYITTRGAWHRHAARFVNSHFIVLDGAGPMEQPASAENREGNCPAGPTVAFDDATPILVLVDADEGAHLALEDESAFEPLPHPLVQKAISDSAQAKLAQHGVAPGATTFDAAEAVGRVPPAAPPPYLLIPAASRHKAKISQVLSTRH